jgi:hypothetical protein
METCLQCEYAEIYTYKGNKVINDCKAAVNRSAFTLRKSCPLKNLKVSYKSGDSRKQKYISDKPHSPLKLSEGEFFPAKYENEKLTILCAEEEGYVKKCDATKNEDCRDCWNKEYEE